MADRTQLSVRVSTRTKAEIERAAAGSGRSQSAVVREWLGARRERVSLAAEVERLRDRLADREERISELEQQLARRSQVEEKVDLLVERVQDDSDAPTPPAPVRWWRWWRQR